jgi:hypothetical protein
MARPWETEEQAMDWKTEFGTDYDIPAAILALVESEQATDLSWHNDTAPSFGLVNETADLRIAVEHPDPTRRELEGGARFIVTMLSRNGITERYLDNALEAAAAYLALYVTLEPAKR